MKTFALAGENEAEGFFDHLWKETKKDAKKIHDAASHDREKGRDPP